MSAKPIKSDNLFDTNLTPLDVVKVLLLIVTAFSTWNIVDVMTPDGAFAFVREIAAVGIIEGAFLGFEFATQRAKNDRQKKFATIGFFCSLFVIAVFAGVSGLLEFGGPALLGSQVGTWAGIDWLAADVVMVFSLGITTAWIVALAAIYRLYDLNDPDRKAEMDRHQMDGDVITTANDAMREALEQVKPVIAIERAVARIEADYKNELTPDQLAQLKSSVRMQLREKYKYQLAPADDSQPARTPAPAPEPAPNWPTPNRYNSETNGLPPFDPPGGLK